MRADRGAHFYKCDFQVHTPRDLNWKGPADTTDGAVDAEARKTYATEFIAACRERGLDAVAITDHHDFAFFPFLREAAERECDDEGNQLPKQSRVIVFPGLELTLAVPCQAILILDAEFPIEWLTVVLTALGVQPASPDEAKHAAVQRLPHINSFKSLHEELDKQSVLRGRYIVLPNVGQGSSSMMRDGFHPKYIEMPCVGGYVDGSLSKLKDSTLAKLEGRVKEWGHKALGLFQTSDNRDRSFADLGQHHTWVKWVEPTAEALRQACLARQSRISQTQPTLPAVQITHISVSHCKFLGAVDLALNPQYNTLIGGRGTGKSSILEYLRWTLCDQLPPEFEEDLPAFQQRRKALVEKTLKEFNAVVQVSALVDGVVHVVRRSSADGGLKLKVGDAGFRDATENEVRTLLPLQAYSQKQLSSVGVKTEELRRFVSLPIQGKLGALQNQFDDLAGKLRSIHEKIREERRIHRERDTAKTELDSVEKRLEGLRKSLKGLSDSDKALIDAQGGWAQERRLVQLWRSEAKDATTSLAELESKFGRLPSSTGAGPFHDAVHLNAIQGLLKAEFAKAAEFVSKAKASFGSQALKTLVAEWEEALKANDAKYQEAKERAAENAAALLQIAELEKKQREVNAQLAELDRNLTDLGNPQKTFENLSGRWAELHDERYGTFEKQTQALNEQSGGLLNAKLGRAADLSRHLELLRELAKGTNIRGERLEAIVRDVASSDQPVQAWLELVAELRRLGEHQDPAPFPKAPRLAQSGVSLDQQRRLAARVAATGWAVLIAAELTDELSFQYRAREGESIPFADASAGQQATALMRVLLNQDGPPLVIDQPEDDLDNNVINEIVAQVWVAKSRRQLIFASHNANLVVNGDAELVACCDYRTSGDHSGGHIKVQGAIDVEAVRKEIAGVMEGGEAAFKLRKEKYGF